MATWLGRNGDINAVTSYGTIGDASYLSIKVGSRFIGYYPSSVTNDASTLLVLGGFVPYSTHGKTPPGDGEGSDGSSGIDHEFFVYRTGYHITATGYSPYVVTTPTSYTASGSATVGILQIGSGGTVTLPGALQVVGTNTTGPTFAASGVVKITGSLTDTGGYGVVGDGSSMVVSGTASFNTGVQFPNVGSVSLIDSNSGTGFGSTSITVTASGTLDTMGLLVGFPQAGSAGSLTVNGTLTDMSKTVGITVGATSAGKSTFTVGATGMVASFAATLGGSDGSADTAIITVGGQWYDEGTFTSYKGGTLTILGQLSANQFNLDGTTTLTGGVMTVLTLSAGEEASPGELLVQSDGMFTAAAGAYIGVPLFATQAGSTVKLTNTTLTDSGSSVSPLGVGAMLNGRVDVTGGAISFTDASSQVLVGFVDSSGAGSGKLGTSGTTVTVSSTVLGMGSNASGTLTIAGGTWTDTGSGMSMQVGAGGAADLQVTNGAVLNDQGASIATASLSGDGLSDQVEVTQNATWNVAGALNVGGPATGQLSVDSGGTVAVTGSATVDAPSSDSSKFSVIDVGGGGTLKANNLTLGSNGQGQLVVDAGGTVTLKGFLLVNHGAVTITGSGATVSATQLYMGAASDSALVNTTTVAGGAILSLTSLAGAVIGANDVLRLSGGAVDADTVNVAAGGAVRGYGILGDVVTNLTQVQGGGSVVAQGGVLEVAGSLSTSSAVINAGASLLVDRDLTGGGTVSFAGTGDKLLVDGVFAPATTISGFVAGDTITLKSAANQAIWINNVLTLGFNGVVVGRFNLPGAYATTGFNVTSIGSGFVSIAVGANSPAATSGVTAPTPSPPPRTDVDDAAAISVAPITDALATTATQVTALLATTNNALSVDASGGAAVSGEGSTRLDITGTLAEVNAALATLTSTAALPGADTLTLDVSDSQGFSDSSSVTIQTADPAVTLTAPGSQSVTAGAPAALSGIAVSSVLTDPALTYRVTVTDATGSLAADATGSDSVTGNGSTSLTITGRLADLDSSLARLAYTATGTATSDTVVITGVDAFGGSTTSAVSVAVAEAAAVTETDWVLPVDGDAGNATNWTSGAPTATEIAGFSDGGYAVGGTIDAGMVTIDGSPTFTGSVSAAGLAGNFATFLDDGMGATFAGGSLTTPSLVVGDTTEASLDLSSGATVTLSGDGPVGETESVYLGLDSAGSGGLTVEGSGTTLQAGTGLDIGDAGTGGFTVSAGASASFGATGGTNDVTDVGNQSTGIGDIHVDGAGTAFSTSDTLYLGIDGLGSLDVTNGGSVTTSGAAGAAVAYLGYNADGTGFGSVDGSGSLWDVTQNLVVGLNGAGYVAVTDGGTLEVDGSLVRVGRNTGATGELDLVGSGSTLDAPNANLNVGLDGSGTVELDEGASATVASVTLGQDADGAIGTFEVNSGSTLNVVGVFSDGLAPDVTVTVSGGTIATGNGLAIGSGGGNTIVDVSDGGAITGGVSIGGSAAVTFDETSTIGGPVKLSGNGTLTFFATSGSGAGALHGAVTVSGGTTDAPATVQAVIGMLDLTNAITFTSGSASVLAVAGQVEIGGSVDGFAPGDTLDLANFVSPVLPDTAVWSDGELSLYADQYGGGALIEQFALPGDYSLSHFSVTPDTSDGGVDLIVQNACYVAGTRIRTERGDVAVEALAIGDLIITASGAVLPIHWIGSRSHVGRFLAAHPGVQPILFRTGSLGRGLPKRDLRVSPKHAMFIDGVLVPAECLLNGNTIVRDRACDRVAYFHVELDAHDILLAEGAPSESFVDDDNRGMFHNADEWESLYPGRERLPAVYCAPRVESGFELEAIRRRLAGVAGEVVLAA